MNPKIPTNSCQTIEEITAILYSNKFYSYVTFTPTAPQIGQMVFSPFGQLVFDQSSVAVGLITLFSRSRNRPRLSLRRLQFNER